MIFPRSFPAALGISFTLGLLYSVYSIRSSSSSFKGYPSQLISSYTKHEPARSGIDRVSNGTLGFEKVFAVGLPERSDKRDALALISSLTGFNINWIDGVRGESVVDNALPFGVDRVQLWENNVGSWRGHMNAVRTMVEENISTALIMEDDMDWDVRIKSQLKQIALGARTIHPFNSSKPHDSPYGNDWDVLWLGHCGEIFPETLPEYSSLSHTDPNYITLSTKFIIHPDPTVPPPEHTAGFQNYTANPYTRWVHISGGPICTFAYALSLEGAKKVLYDLSVDHLVGPFDNALAGLCRWGRDEGRLGMKCLSVTPPLFMHHKPKGYVFRDSDIQSYGGKGNKGKGELREKGTTENMVWSARLNIKELLTGGEMKSQFEGN